MTIYASPCGLLRRFGAILYDAILLLAIVLIASLPVVIAMDGAADGELWFTGYVLAIGYVYFAWFWIHGGQTLGMRTWRIVIIRDDGGRPGWRDCLLRYGVAIASWLPLAGGFLWGLVDAEKRTLHDLASGTSLVVLPRANPT